MRLVLKSYISTLLALFLTLSLTLVLSCTGGGFSGSSGAGEKEDDDAEIGEGIYDNDKDNEISESEYESLKDKLGQAEFLVGRVEGDRLGDGILTATFSLSKVDGTKVSSAVKEKSKTTVVFYKKGVEKGYTYTSGDGSHLCPLDNKNVVLNVSLTYNEESLEISDTYRVLGGREDKKAVWIGIADKAESVPHFHNIDTIITEVRCPKAKKLKITSHCEDETLDNATLRKCWRIEGSCLTNSEACMCPHDNVYTNDSEYNIQCKNK